jgi:hypothetical protein
MLQLQELPMRLMRKWGSQRGSNRSLQPAKFHAEGCVGGRIPELERFGGAIIRRAKYGFIAPQFASSSLKSKNALTDLRRLREPALSR